MVLQGVSFSTYDWISILSSVNWLIISLKGKVITCPLPGKKSFVCFNFYKYIILGCLREHLVYKPIRCMKCIGCKKFKKAKYTARLFERFKDYSKRESTDFFTFWTFGTRIRRSESYKVISRYWTKFRMRMNTALRDGRLMYWKPLFKIVEVGDGGYYHIHVIVNGFAKHKFVRRMWNSVIQGLHFDNEKVLEDLNVNYVKKASGFGYEKSVNYSLKYMEKGSSKSILGKLRIKPVQEYTAKIVIDTIEKKFQIIKKKVPRIVSKCYCGEKSYFDGLVEIDNKFSRGYSQPYKGLNEYGY